MTEEIKVTYIPNIDLPGAASKLLNSGRKDTAVLAQADIIAPVTKPALRLQQLALGQLPTLGQAVIWHLDISEISTLSADCAFSISGTEKARADRFAGQQDALRFIAGRVMLRTALAKWQHCHVSDVQIALTNKGKPFCPTVAGLQFNIAHSGDHVLLALLSSTATAAAIGVDIEFKRPLNNYDVLARRSFDTNSSLDVATRFGIEKQKSFYGHWCRLESGLKALGTGLSTDPIDLQELSALYYQKLDIAPGYSAAIATVEPVAVIEVQNLNSGARYSMKREAA